jgi:hypothetical protein
MALQSLATKNVAAQQGVKGKPILGNGNLFNLPEGYMAKAKARIRMLQNPNNLGERKPLSPTKAALMAGKHPVAAGDGKVEAKIVEGVGAAGAFNPAESGAKTEKGIEVKDLSGLLYAMSTSEGMQEQGMVPKTTNLYRKEVVALGSIG